MSLRLTDIFKLLISGEESNLFEKNSENILFNNLG